MGNYCNAFNIAPDERNELILLATIGSRGPSSLVFEPDFSNSFKGADLQRFRQQLNLSTREFANCFGLSQASIVRIENDKVSGSEVLKLIELFVRFPETAKFYIEKYAVKLHSKTKSRVLTKLHEITKQIS